LGSVIYCVVPRDLARKLHDPLRRHFRDDAGVEVVVERRGRERRSPAQRRAPEGGTTAQERRRIHNAGGRRVGERRLPVVPVNAPALPRRVRTFADQLVFVERMAPSAEQAEDLDTARLVTRIQGGDREGYAELYLRYFDRVYGYLRVVIRDQHEAEDLAQQVFVKALEGMPRYERRGTIPFRVWLFTIVRRTAFDALNVRQRTEVTSPAQLSKALDSRAGETDLHALSWVTDRELVMLMERLPLAQRQVLMLRFMLDLTHGEIAEVLHRTPADVRILTHRGLRFLEKRLRALGRAPIVGRRERARSCQKQAWVLRHRRFALK
jgi:RNA polymerase sigma-70 factor (ECF subfamily)